MRGAALAAFGVLLIAPTLAEPLPEFPQEPLVMERDVPSDPWPTCVFQQIDRLALMDRAAPPEQVARAAFQKCKSFEKSFFDEQRKIGTPPTIMLEVLDGIKKSTMNTLILRVIEKRGEAK